MFRIYYAGRMDKEVDALSHLTDHGEKMRSVRFGSKDMERNGVEIPFFEKDLEEFGYTYVGSTTVKSKEEIFEAYQGDFCSKEFAAHIKETGATHTSMSVGDILVEVSTGDLYFCDSFDWKVL